MLCLFLAALDQVSQIFQRLRSTQLFRRPSWPLRYQRLSVISEVVVNIAGWERESSTSRITDNYNIFCSNRAYLLASAT